MGVMVISNRVSALLKGPLRSAWELPRRVGGEGWTDAAARRPARGCWAGVDLGDAGDPWSGRRRWGAARTPRRRPARGSAADGGPGMLDAEPAVMPGAGRAAPVPRVCAAGRRTRLGRPGAPGEASSSHLRATAGRVRVRRSGRLSAGCAVPGTHGAAEGAVGTRRGARTRRTRGAGPVPGPGQGRRGTGAGHHR